MTNHAPSIAAREVTNKDLEIIDKVIAGHETFQTHLYTLRRVLSEIGDLDKRCRGLRDSIEHLQAESANVNRAWEHAKSELAKVQQQEVETRKRVAALTAEVEQKQRMLEHYSQQINRITGAAA